MRQDDENPRAAHCLSHFGFMERAIRIDFPYLQTFPDINEADHKPHISYSAYRDVVLKISDSGSTCLLLYVLHNDASLKPAHTQSSVRNQWYSVRALFRCNSEMTALYFKEPECPTTKPSFLR